MAGVGPIPVSPETIRIGALPPGSVDLAAQLPCHGAKLLRVLTEAPAQRIQLFNVRSELCHGPILLAVSGVLRDRPGSFLRWPPTRRRGDILLTRTLRILGNQVVTPNGGSCGHLEDEGAGAEVDPRTVLQPDRDPFMYTDRLVAPSADDVGAVA